MVEGGVASSLAGISAMGQASGETAVEVGGS